MNLLRDKGTLIENLATGANACLSQAMEESNVNGECFVTASGSKVKCFINSNPVRPLYLVSKDPIHKLYPRPKGN